ncbi:MAG TPA: hypothetical protein VNO84_17545 [Burkholderiaceae bacterium]|nr:hypothetical protein [Burkholderiaceae bacterium]
MSPKRIAWTMAAAFALVVLGGCGEEPQTAKAAYKRTDAPAWQGAENPYVASGWKPGDAESWNQQMRRRAQGQNEYTRAN